MAAGRPRKPKKVIDLTKTVPKNKQGNRNDDIVPTLKRGTTISAPKTLTNEYAIKQWDAVSQQLINLEVLALQDLPTLEQAFIFLEEYHNTLDSIHRLRGQSEEAIIDDKKVEILHKLNSILNKTSQSYNQIMYRFGITPVERTKLQFKEGGQAQDPIEQLLAEEVS